MDGERRDMPQPPPHEWRQPIPSEHFSDFRPSVVNYDEYVLERFVCEKKMYYIYQLKTLSRTFFFQRLIDGYRHK